MTIVSRLLGKQQQQIQQQQEGRGGGGGGGGGGGFERHLRHFNAVTESREVVKVLFAHLSLAKNTGSSISILSIPGRMPTL